MGRRPHRVIERDAFVVSSLVELVDQASRGWTGHLSLRPCLRGRRSAVCVTGARRLAASFPMTPM